MDDLLGEFLTECLESMTELDVELVRLEQNPQDLDLIASIFRMVHTIKGTCGFLGLMRLEAVAHAAENVLGKFRDGEMVVTPGAVTLILEALDRIKFILDGLSENQAEPEGEDSELINRLNATANGEDIPAESANDQKIDHPESAEKQNDTAVNESSNPTASEPEPVASQSEIQAEPIENESKKTNSIDRATNEEKTKNIANTAAAPKADADSNKSAAVTSQSLRVPVDLLENLMTLVGELVLTRNQLLQMVRNSADSEFKAPLQRLSHITSELQEGVMKTRMQPIGNAWSKLPRLIRDLGLDLGKQIELKMIGAETELDRQVLELIKDPLTHMVRNSADHGLELPGERKQVGKPEKGTVTLNAFHEGGHIIIQISDDGKGLDCDRIREKALANGITSEAELAMLSDQQVMQFIFKAGFSTAAAVTNVSGRGVGMDVVRTNIEKIGGSIELKSEKGKGSTFTIKIPLTLAIVSALIVAAGPERFAIPQIGVVELVRAGHNSEHKIEIINGSPILRLRNRLLPLLTLSRLLNLESRTDIELSRDAYVVVSQVGNTLFGLIVDQVYDTEEIVVKPVAPILRDINVFSGNTILGDGSVVMILDLNGITGTMAAGAAAQQDKHEKSSERTATELTSLLLFRAGQGAPKAVPLALVTRLEEVSAESVEWSGTNTVMQYRGQLMPLTTIDVEPVNVGQETKPVLVFTDVGRNMGLVVDEIIDIAEVSVNVEMRGGADTILGTAIIADRSTELLDVGHYVNRVFGGWFEDQEVEPFENESTETGNRVLLVDDSSLFRNLLKPMLEANGYIVSTAENPHEALQLRDTGRNFNIIVSDIEMPGMNGFEFAEECRRQGSWQNTPIIALTSHTTPKDIERGREVGFTDYVGKLDKESLLDALANCQQLNSGS